jgi:hypothetical protein
MIIALALTAGALGMGDANAQPVTDGGFAFSGDPGDYISGGGSYKYSPRDNDVLDVSTNGNHAAVSVQGANGDWWTLDLAAPEGQPLKAGVYDGASRYPFQPPSMPGLSLYGNGRGCNQSTGTFTIREIVLGPFNYVHKLDATFEQHCEGDPDTAARGEVRIMNAPPPAELDLGLSVATDGKASTLNGKAIVHGTVTCTEPVQVSVSGRVTQVKNRVIIRGDYLTLVACVPGAPVKWTASADPIGTTPYDKGKAEVVTRATARDPHYPADVTRDTTTVVTLKRV